MGEESQPTEQETAPTDEDVINAPGWDNPPAGEEPEVSEEVSEPLYYRVPKGKQWRYVKAEGDRCGQQLYRKVKGRYVAV